VEAGLPEIDIHAVRADDLRFLVALANTGRLTAAATALGVDNSTVSRRIRALEKVLRARLIERGSDGWELTETGRVVAEYARPIQKAVDQAALAAGGARPDMLTGTIRITAPDGFGTIFVVPALAQVRRQHPNLNVELITATRQLSLYQSGFDLAIAVGKPESARLFTELLTEYTLELYASEAYLDAYGEPAGAEEFQRHTLIFYVDSLLQVGDLDLSRYLPEVTARFTSTNVFAQLEATRQGAGIGLLPKYVATRAPELRRVCPQIPPLWLGFTLAVRRDSISRPNVQVVREAIHHQVHIRRHELS
jgi:DNA-binding transcriptional LysR family regulator